MRINTPSACILLNWMLLVALLVLLPYVMSLNAYTEIDISGLVKHDAREINRRAPFIAFGLIAAVAGTIVWMTGFKAIIKNVKDNRARSSGLLLLSSQLLCILTIGWRLFPYFVNGIFQRTWHDGSPWGLDPKSLMPMIWIGDIWRLGVLLLYIIVPLGLFILTFALAFYRGRGCLDKSKFWTPAMILMFTCVAFFFPPHYLDWLMD